MVRQLLTSLLLILIVPGAAAAQYIQDPVDAGAADTVVITYSIEETGVSGQYDLHLDLLMCVDADSLAGAGLAFAWDDSRVTVASASVTPLAESALGFISMAYRSNDIDSSNFYQQIVFAGLRNALPGIGPNAGRQHLASYDLVLSDWTETDTLVIDTAFCISYALEVVDNDLSVYRPYWSGPLRIGVPGCCDLRVGDANGVGGDEPTIGDLSVIVDALFISGHCDGVIACLAEADVNQSGGPDPECDDITIGDYSILNDYLFITGSSLGLNDCF